MINNGEPAVDAALWHSYSNAFFHFPSEWQSERFAVVTAWNPASILRSNQENCISNQSMKTRMKGLRFCSVLVSDDTCSWSEESFAVEMELSEALHLARAFQQNAIYFVEHGALFLVSCLSDQRRESLGPFKKRIR